MANKLTAPIGTTARIAWPDVTSWNLCGWSYVRTDGTGYAILERTRACA